MIEGFPLITTFVFDHFTNIFAWNHKELFESNGRVKWTQS